MSHLSLKERELAAIGASLASNCIPCIEYHVRKGRDAGLTEEAIGEALEIAEFVRKVPARRVREAARAALGREGPRSGAVAEAPTCRGAPSQAALERTGEPSCCGPGAGP